MTADTTGPADAVDRAVKLFADVGLTEYEARCLVALIRIGHGTAKEISDVADVPRARVYDSMDALQTRGLADVQGSQPRRYRAVGTDETVDRLRREFDDRFEELSDLLPRLSSPDSRAESPGVWALEGDTAVSDRLAALVEDAEQELLLVVATEGLLTRELLGALGDAVDRGVDVTVASPAATIREAVTGAAPGADVRETWTWWETHPIRTGEISSILLADGRDLLVSSTLESDLPDVDRHAAVWSDDRDAPVVGVMRPLLTEAVGAA
jgi:sugar-specific transcriptional regulator TrmB